MLTRTCITCGGKTDVSFETLTDLVCQSCGSINFRIDTSTLAVCRCGAEIKFRKEFVNKAFHECNEKSRSTTFMFPAPKLSPSKRKIIEKTKELCEGTLKIAVPYYSCDPRTEKAIRSWIYPETVYILTDQLIIPPGAGVCRQIYTSQNSKKIGVGNKTYPLLIDMLKNLVEHFPGMDYYGYCNSDIILPLGKSVYSLLPRKGKIASIHHRHDICFEKNSPEIWNVIKKGRIVVGKDAFIFNAEVCNEVINNFPEMIIGAPFWDTALACWLFDKYGFDNLDFAYGELFHEIHRTGQEELSSYQWPEGRYNRKQMLSFLGQTLSQGKWEIICDENNSRSTKGLKKKKVGIIQPGRLGDIIICLPIAKYYFDRGYEVVWPVLKEFIDVFERINYVNVIPIENISTSYNESKAILAKENLDKLIDLGIGFGKDESEWRAGKLRFDEWKYKEAGVPIEEKYKLSFRRDEAKEIALAEYLDLESFRDGYVVTQSASSFANYDFNIPDAIEIKKIEGFCIFDWISVIEGAKYVYCVDSSALNLINQLALLPERRYVRSWHNIRPMSSATILTPSLGPNWKPHNPIKYRKLEYPEYINDNNASSHILGFAKKHCRGIGIDIGGGNNPFPGAKLIDIKQGNEAIESLENESKNSYDYVFSSHFLEHVEDYEKVLQGCWKVLKEDGILFLYLPHPEMQYWLPSNPSMQGKYGHKVVLYPDLVIEKLVSIGFEIVDSTNSPDHYWSYCVVAKKPLKKKISLPKITFLMIVYNGMPFIKSCIESILPFAHEIIVVEGVVEDFSKNTLSTDGTTDVLDDLEKEHSKIKVLRFRKKRKFKFKKDMQNLGVKYATGDYVWIVDCDEFYLAKDIGKVLRLISETQPKKIGFRINNFFKGCDYVMDGDEKKRFYGMNYAWRVFKWETGMQFIEHRPIKTNKKLSGEIFTPGLMESHGIKMFHFGYIFNSQVKSKIDFYQKRLIGHEGMEDWYENFFKKWTPGNREQIESNGYGVWPPDQTTKTVRYTGELPNRIINLFREERNEETERD